jgi:hypothetical protein
LEIENAWLEHLDNTMKCAIVVSKWGTAISFSAPRILVQKYWLSLFLSMQNSPMLSRTELSDILSCSGDTVNTRYSPSRSMRGNQTVLPYEYSCFAVQRCQNGQPRELIKKELKG